MKLYCSFYDDGTTLTVDTNYLMGVNRNIRKIKRKSFPSREPKDKLSLSFMIKAKALGLPIQKCSTMKIAPSPALFARGYIPNMRNVFEQINENLYAWKDRLIYL